MADKTTNTQELQQQWNKGKAWIDSFTDDFESLDNLADGVALNSDPKAPQVGSMTLPVSIRQIPRASVQQLPTFGVEVNGTKLSVAAIVCDYLLRRSVFNQDTFGKGILSTIQIGAESALTRGFQAFTSSLGSSLTGFGTSLKQVHYEDIVLEPGIFDASDSSYYMIRTRVTKGRLKKLIKDVESNPETAWNVKALKELLNTGGNDNYSEYRQSEPRYNPNINSGRDSFDIITNYDVGPFHKITIFAFGVQTPLRETNSRSKFGFPRAQLLVLDPAQLSPLGVSRARLASPWANYMNIFMQSTAKMMLFNADPPVFQRGQFTSPVTMKRGALWQAIDPNAEVKLQEMSNSTISQFKTILNYGDDQVHSIMGVTPGGDTSNTGAYQNSTSSKMEQSAKDMTALQVTNILENFLRQYALTALDLFISEQEGETDLIIDDKAKQAINNLAEGKFKPQLDPQTGTPLEEFVPPIGDDNIITINWEEFYNGKVKMTEEVDPMTGEPMQGEPVIGEDGQPVREGGIQTLTVDIDLSMTKDTLDEKKRADLQDMLTVMSQTTDPADPQGMQLKHSLEKELLQQTLPDLAKTNEQNPAPAQQMMPQAPVDQA